MKFFKFWMKNKKPRKKGFTLIELLVAMVLFVSIVSIVSAIFVTSIRAERQVTALIAANDNTFLALEQMAREMRIGRIFNVPSSSDIDFFNAHGEHVYYHYDGASITRSLEGPVVGAQKITAENVNIGSFKIISQGTGQNDGEPSRITLVLSVGANNAPDLAGIFTNIQTTVVVRNLDQ
jgi:prepilin-type N-terminal cleavage/methylation domain-containing protein